MPGESEPQKDALDTLVSQNQAIGDLFKQWDSSTEILQAGDDVDVRWKRGTVAKMLVEHFAVREAALGSIDDRLRKVDASLANRVKGNGVERRRSIDRLFELTRGQGPMMLNNPEVDAAVPTLHAIFDQEMQSETESIPAVERALGARGQRGLPTEHWVRMHSSTYPSPEPRWFDRIGPLKALRSAYDQFRLAPYEGVDRTADRTGASRPGPSRQS
jgi:hypothetical protein